MRSSTSLLIEHRRVQARSYARRLRSSAKWRVIFCGLSVLTGRPIFVNAFAGLLLALPAPGVFPLFFLAVIVA